VAAHVYQQETRGTIAARSGDYWSCKPAKQPDILQQASNGEQREAESLPDGGGAADQAKSRPGGGAADQEQSKR
jgi:hypothetical protein